MRYGKPSDRLSGQSYLKDDFLLSNKTAKKLYTAYAENMPIIDYHCHLPEKQILENAEIKDIYEVWLAGDHYKWRLMRNFGVEEDYITGNRSHKEKFLAYCRTLETAFGNPLYHWSAAELKTFFHCTLEICEANADAIWEQCNDYIRAHKLTPQSLITQSRVEYVFTTNEVFDDLSTFEKIREKGYDFQVLPAFRADKIMNIDAEGYLTFVERLQALTQPIQTLGDLEEALKMRLAAFIAVGAKAADIALESVYPLSDRETADGIFRRVLGGERPSENETRQFKSYLTYFLMKMYAKHNIVTELHMGAMRNNNTVMLQKLGLDTGFDSISEENSIKHLSRLMDRLHSEGALPKLILFNLHPKMNGEIMTLLGCFQDASAKGKIQYGPAWWFLDNKVGMERHLEDLSATGHIGAFIGMLTDSRSLLSYPRHHYFRRILCNYFGTMMEAGLMTQNTATVGRVIQDICYNNALQYFGLSAQK